MYFTITLLWLSASTFALKVTSPSKDSKWTTSTAQTVRFESVSTDPTSVNIVLVNQHVYPPVSMVVGSGVDTSSGSFVIPADKFGGLASGEGYQVNLVSPTNDGILAQSGTFMVEASANAAATSVSSSDGHSGPMATSHSAASNGAEAVATSASTAQTMTSSQSASGSPTASNPNASSASNTSATPTPNAATLTSGQTVSKLTGALMAACMLFF